MGGEGRRLKGGEGEVEGRGGARVGRDGRRLRGGEEVEGRKGGKVPESRRKRETIYRYIYL